MPKSEQLQTPPLAEHVQADSTREWRFKRRDARSHTITMRRLSRTEIRAGTILSLSEADASDRPRTRGECRKGPRPCPWVSCRHHLYLDVNPRTGSLKINFPHLEIDELSESCALDVAERGGLTLDGIGVLMNLTRERVRQMEHSALLVARLVADKLELDS